MVGASVAAAVVLVVDVDTFVGVDTVVDVAAFVIVDTVVDVAAAVVLVDIVVDAADASVSAAVVLVVRVDTVVDVNAVSYMLQSRNFKLSNVTHILKKEINFYSLTNILAD